MIVVEAGRNDERGFDAKLIFAAQLSDRGHAVVIDEETIPEKFERSQKYEAAPYLARLEGLDIEAILVIGAEDIADETLGRLWRLAADGGVKIVAIGRFANHQAMIAARSRLAYAVGREPEMVDLTDLYGPDIPVQAVSPLAAPGLREDTGQRMPPELYVFLSPDLLEEPQTLPLLAALDHAPGFHLSVVTPAAGKERIRKSRYTGLNVYSYSELAPSILARRADIAVFYGETAPGERMAAFAIELMASGRVVVDCTLAGAFKGAGAPVLRGPEELAALQNFLDVFVLVNREGIGREARTSPWIAARDIAHLERAIGLEPAPPAVRETGARVLFVPTNGNGLGHAQRCTLIAAELGPEPAAEFAAFPSCVPLIKGRGFPCLPLVQKSPDHPEDYANDLVNYLRLRRILCESDHLVFDGGYVFDSIFRTIHETGCRATWIRRGLWRPGQVSSAQIERERAFHQVIVPGEAFEELNADYSRGPHVRSVGPVVQPSPEVDTPALRERIAHAAGVEFETLVVSMLGGGVAADRSAQLQRLSGLLARREDCLHLIVVWPNSTVAPGLLGWSNTRVVRTHNSLGLCMAADLVVSAVGYNSFHELLYSGVPTVFVPQVAPYMDDQERRARAASDRGLARTVLAHELIGLERAVTEMLGGAAEEVRSRLGEVALPEPGNRAAADLIGMEGGA